MDAFMLKEQVKIYKGHVIFTKTLHKFTIIKNGYIIVKNGKVLKVFETLPEQYKQMQVEDYGDKLIIPGLVDLHLHAPQFPNKGLCLDVQLLEWLEQCIFPEETHYNNLIYARNVYSQLIEKLWEAGTTRVLMFNTIHKSSTKLLLDMMIQSGLGAFIGKVNMDINAPNYLLEDTQQSLSDTEEIIVEYRNKSFLVKPIIAPRFVPACSPTLMMGLGQLAKQYDAPILSHISEQIEEIQLVKNMYPNFPTYGSVYSYFGLFGQQPTVMGHAVHSSNEEMILIKNHGVYIAHCPSSNCNLGSGMMPVRKFLNMGINVGLGSDVAGGHTVSILKSMVYAIATSKMVWLYSNKTLPPLTAHEAFYLGTKGGGSFWGKVGSFEEGYDFDALVIDDSSLNSLDYTLTERIQRFIYLGNGSNIVERFVAGNQIKRPNFDQS